MIVRSRSRLLSGYQAVIDASLQSGCRAYFASPSPFHSLMLEEGSRRFREAHASFVQAESPAAAMAMALGSASTGARILVSGNLQDFAQMQEALGFALVQNCPCVIVLLCDGGPGMTLSRPVFHPLRYFLSPCLTSGFPLLSLMPESLQAVYDLTREAFGLSEIYQQPVLVLVDPLLFQVGGSIGAERKSGRAVLEKTAGLRATGQACLAFLEAQMTRIEEQEARRLRWVGEVGPVLCSVGSLGGWLAELELAGYQIAVPRSLWPFPADALEQAAAGQKLYWVEYDQPVLSKRLRQLYPQLSFEPLCLPWQEPWPLGLKHSLLERLPEVSV